MGSDNNRFIYRRTSSDYFQNTSHIFSLDYYKKYSSGEHEFSRKQVWFYVYGDEDIREEFSENMSSMINNSFKEGDIEWDMITVYPSFIKDQKNENMVNLAKDISEETNYNYEDVLRRRHTVRENHSLESLREKIINLEGSLELQQNVEDKNILLINNISLTGTSFMHATDILKDAGANKVACICLGIDERNKENDYELNGETVEEVFQKSLNPLVPERGD